MEALKNQWIDLAKKYSDNAVLINQCYEMLSHSYNEPHRYYHNLNHISSMLKVINDSDNIEANKTALFFSTWFHDVVYNPRKHDNEERSAFLALEKLKALTVPEEIINKVNRLILATASHTEAQKNDDTLSFFLDCDLQILGTKREEYLIYSENIRKEYKHVISFIYRRERKKVLQRFINSESIYRTKHFKNKYEDQARSNISFELNNL